ncbi:MAG: hypothetical protein KDD02_10610, partial [Phaeodactylibacter sp.]|nr:hypothetical protein [Phaeodactylibacter sp.]
TDDNGNSSSCIATVTVEDNVAPAAVCQNLTVQLNASGNAAVTSANIGSNSTDACGIAFLFIDNSNFSCADVGPNTVTLTAIDVNSNVSTCTAVVRVEDNVAPAALCQDITVQLDANGAASISGGAVDAGSSDACGIASLLASPNSFDCTDVGNNNSVTLTVTDVNGNSSTCTATITVEDKVAPVALCQDLTIQLDAGGQASITPQDVDNGSSDACGVASLSLSQEDFSCANIAVNPTLVALAVTDIYGNSSSCTARVTVEDNIAPVALCEDVTVQLDANGNGSTTADQVDNGSNDACGIQSVVLSMELFSCADVGINPVTLTVTDVNENTSTCTATVMVEDNVAPVALCQDITVQLDGSGNALITSFDIGGGSTDACGIAFLFIDNDDFTCADVGPNTVTITAIDVNSNVSNCSATVTVEDNVAPTALCQDITVQLDDSGVASITAAQVDGGSSDACGIASISAIPNNFDCGKVGANPVTLTVTDVNGNSSSCAATVMVEDNIAPVALCQNITIQLDAGGSAIIAGEDLDGGSSDACGIESVAVSQKSFSCIDVGVNPVTLTVTDVNGNTSFCSATVTVEDNVAPVALCQDITVQLDANGTASITAAQVDGGSSDACGTTPATISLNSFDCSDVGLNSVTLTVTDVNGNSSSCTATVTVEDNVAPRTECQGVIVQLNANGAYNLSAGSIDGGSSDACGIAGLSVSPNSFGCDDLGDNPVTLTATDVNGNSSSCMAIVTVEDVTAPVAVCLNTTVSLDASGAYTLLETDVLDFVNSYDNCSFSVSSISTDMVSCDDFETTIPVLVTIMDPSGNTDDCIANVYVERGDALPAPWSSQDIGNPGAGNTYDFDPCQMPPRFTITANANNSNSASDNIAFIEQELCGDFQITVRIESVTPTGYAGLMARESSASGSKMVGMYSNLSSLVRWESRAITNGNRLQNFFFNPLPYWLRLQRQGNLFYGYASYDGVNFSIVTAQQIPMNGCLEVGLAAFTNVTGIPATVVFSNVSVEGGVLPLANLPGNDLQEAAAGKEPMQVQLYPNPARDMVTLELLGVSPEASATTVLRLRNQQGKLIEERRFDGDALRVEWDINRLQSGLYQIEVDRTNEAPQVVRFIKAE